jgi:hypothetical protein
LRKRKDEIQLEIKVVLQWKWWQKDVKKHEIDNLQQHYAIASEYTKNV